MVQGVLGASTIFFLDYMLVRGQHKGGRVQYG